MTALAPPYPRSTSSVTALPAQSEPRLVGRPHIAVRRWFDRVNGNTYHSVRIFAGGVLVAHVPIAYGYDDTWTQTALGALRSQGLDVPEGAHGTLYIRETLGASTDVVDVTRKRDL